MEGGIHPLDLWRYWFGDVVWVQAQYVHRPSAEISDGADNPYAYSATFGFANGAVGNLTLSRLRRVLWNEGRLVLEGEDLVAYHYEGAYPPAAKPSTESVRHVFDLPARRDTMLVIARAFIEAVAHEDPVRVRSPFSDAMNSLAAVIAANVSDELGGARVDVDELLTAEKYTPFRQKSRGSQDVVRG